MIAVKDILPYVRFASGFRRYLRTSLDATSARAQVTQRLAGREAALAQGLDRFVYGYAASPYLRLLEAAGCEPGDVLRLLRTDGVEATLARLAASGVYIALEEFKGQRAAVRGSHSFTFRESDFDNPYLAHDLEVQSGGTRSAGTRVLVKLEFTASLAADTATLFDESQLKQTFLEHIGWGDGAVKAMSVVWRQADILEVRRVLPISTRMGKVQPFHLERAPRKAVAPREEG